MPFGTLILSGVLALLAGTLFRLAGELNVPALRMLGFWSLVAIGLLFSRAAARQQVADGWARLRQALAGLGPDFLVVPAMEGAGEDGGAAPVVQPLFIVAPGGVLALMPDAMADYGRGALARRRLAAGAARARAWAEAGAAAAASAEAGRDTPLVPCLLLLRRRAPQERAEPGAGEPVVVNPEGVPVLAGRFRHSGRLDPAARQAVADALTAWIAASGGKQIR